MDDRIQGTFISEKISKVRWKPESGFESYHFVTGSWDNEDLNRVTLWSCPGEGIDEKDDPCMVCEKPITGDVTELKFVQNDQFLVSTSSSSVELIKIVGVGDAASTVLKPIVSWDKLHPFKTGELGACTGFATFLTDVATIGENGSIVSLNLEKRQPIRIIESADSCSLRCVLYLRHSEILTGNLRGQMKKWDLRVADDKPHMTFMLSGDQVSLSATCIAQHPTQQHTLLVGGEDGSITVWDLRQTSYAVPLAAHSGLVSEMIFHADRPEHLFSTSSSGEAWHWDTSSVSRSVRPNQNTPWTGFDPLQNENPWLNTDAVKHRLNVVSLMPTLHKGINSVDVNKDKAVVGCDNEAVYIITDVLNSRM
ncbi:nucleoporin Nup43 [Frankliniella occidentalis]|uniref:Nucleoporin Nup43 n=1 Tax=Frankliniella occidentalis TaxID=133901 RepID=A0A6J1SZ40_FRAOC|nr:nucleoporin Nup43 [Frankliniella occidentalis]